MYGAELQSLHKRSPARFVEMFKYASNAVINNSQYLSELDMIGDADFGVNISSGFEKILVKLTPLNDPEIGSVLELAGDIFILEIGATIGGFLGLAFQRAGRQLRGEKDSELARHSYDVGDDAYDNKGNRRGKEWR